MAGRGISGTPGESSRDRVRIARDRQCPRKASRKSAQASDSCPNAEPVRGRVIVHVRSAAKFLLPNRCPPILEVGLSCHGKASPPSTPAHIDHRKRSRSRPLLIAVGAEFFNRSCGRSKCCGRLRASPVEREIYFRRVVRVTMTVFSDARGQLCIEPSSRQQQLTPHCFGPSSATVRQTSPRRKKR
jgi:hypothetical protein